MPAFSTTEHLLTNDAGREYRLRHWRPANVAPETHLPTLLFLDGHWLDDTLSCALDTVDANTVQIASLGYRLADRSILAPWRAYDYTPAGPQGLLSDPRKAQWPCGGADALLDFLREQVLPLLTHAATAQSPAAVSLFGHSYAGLFSLYSWIKQPAMFNRFYSASPSLWWYWPHMLAALQERHPGELLDIGNATPVHMLVGSDERWRPLPAVAGATREFGVSTVPFAQRFHAALRASGHPDNSLEILPGLAHGPMLHSAVRNTLKHFLAMTA
ncbi:alpha/beta hydrolase [Alcaligenaceae bacterium]|nr:alpha/beta hydrolase [Alcaligenaceae bacterium]